MGLLTIVEQVPGLTVAADMTGALERGYWPSYNVPYFPEVHLVTPFFVVRLLCHRLLCFMHETWLGHKLATQNRMLPMRCRLLHTLCAMHGSLCKLCLLQIYERAGYKAFRDAHAARGADFAAAVSTRGRLAVRRLCIKFRIGIALHWPCDHAIIAVLHRTVVLQAVSACSLK